MSFTIGDTIKATLTDGEIICGMVVENERGFVVVISSEGERFVFRANRPENWSSFVCYRDITRILWSCV